MRRSLQEIKSVGPIQCAKHLSAGNGEGASASQNRILQSRRRDGLKYCFQRNILAFKCSHSSEIFKWSGLSFVLPEASKWLSDHVDALINTHFGTGYQSWEQKLYTQENLASYLVVLTDLAAFLRRHGISFLFVLTPDNGGKRFDRIYAKAIPLFETVGVPCLNLLPVVRDELGCKVLRIYQANPADRHPGPPLTAIYARETAEVI